jgi:hypothetical protein
VNGKKCFIVIKYTERQIDHFNHFKSKLSGTKSIHNVTQPLPLPAPGSSSVPVLLVIILGIARILVVGNYLPPK